MHVHVVLVEVVDRRAQLAIRVVDVHASNSSSNPDLNDLRNPDDGRRDQDDNPPDQPPPNQMFVYGCRLPWLAGKPSKPPIPPLLPRVSPMGQKTHIPAMADVQKPGDEPGRGFASRDSAPFLLA